MSTMNRSPGAIAKPAQSPASDAESSAASTASGQEALTSHRKATSASHTGSDSESIVRRVLPNALADGQMPDCSNVLQNKTFSDVEALDSVCEQTEYSDKSPAGVELNMFVWKPVHCSPRGAIVLCAGYLDSMTHVFGAWASEYARLGLLVVGFNQPGMGSPGTIGLCEDWQSYVDNALFATDTAVHLLGGTWTASGHPDVPVFIYGQSMGGAVAIDSARRRPNAYRGVILSSPMCGIAPQAIPNDCAVGVLRTLEWVAPTAALVPQEDILALCTKCPYQYKHMRAKGQREGMPARPLLRTGVQLFDATLDIQAHVGDFAPPSVLLIQGSLDKVTDGQLTREYIRGCGAGDKTYITYKNAWHALEWEPVDTRMALIHDLTYWVAARVDAWEEGNAELAAALWGRAAVPVEPWGGDGPTSAGGASASSLSSLGESDGPTSSCAASHTPPSVALGPTPAGDSDMQWREEDGVLWGEREEGTGMIPDHDESFLVVKGGVLPDPAARLKRPTLGEAPTDSASTPQELDHPPLMEQDAARSATAVVSASEV